MTLATSAAASMMTRTLIALFSRPSGASALLEVSSLSVNLSGDTAKARRDICDLIVELGVFAAQGTRFLPYVDEY